LPPEGEALLLKVANDAGVELLTAVDLEGMIERKTDLLEAFKPRLFISVGGSQSNLGSSLDVLQLHTGLVPASEASIAGNGVIGFAMQNDIPVIHMLNFKSISERAGIPYDSIPRKMGPTQSSIGWSVPGVLLFFIVLFIHKRWRLEPPEE
jgi:poly-gamma-glutamate system protein